MLTVQTVDDYHGELKSLFFDLVIFSCGYENRSTYLLKQFEESHLERAIVFGFSNHVDSPQRIINDREFVSRGMEIITIANEDDIYRILNTFEFDSKYSKLEVLVDYSSMPRNWCNAIISWTRFQDKFNEVNIFFSYTIGNYKMKFEPFIVENIVSLPGLEGSDIYNEDSVVLFGIGYDGDVMLSVYDQLEPDVALIYTADRLGDEKAINLNKELINNSDRNVVKIPLNSVENAFRSLGEMVSSFIHNSHITFVPMGPKTLTLASILICHRFNQITCLHVRGNREKAHEEIVPSGQIVVSRVGFSLPV